MSVKVGMFSKARNVNHIMVGVNGAARRVKKVYIGDETGSAKLCYEDKVSGVISATISTTNNSSPILCGAYVVDGQYYASGFFKKSTTLSKLKISSSGNVEDTGLTLSFGAGALVYNLPMYGNKSTLHVASENLFSFSGGVNGGMYITAANIYTMEMHTFSDSSNSIIGFSPAPDGTLAVGVGPSKQHANGKRFMMPTKSSTQITGTRQYNPQTGWLETIVFKWSNDGVVSEVFGYETEPRACISCWGASRGSGSSTAEEVQETIGVDAGDIRICYFQFIDGTLNYIEQFPFSDSIDENSNLYIGTAIEGYFYDGAEGIPRKPYVNTVCYTSGDERVTNLIVDYSMDGIETLPEDSTNLYVYEERQKITEGDTNDSLYNWHVLGVADGKVFVLSTVKGGNIKILVFEHSKDGGINPVMEFDVGKRISDTVTLGDITPVRYYGNKLSDNAFVPAFILKRGNYTELVIVPRTAIGQ